MLNVSRSVIRLLCFKFVVCFVLFLWRGPDRMVVGFTTMEMTLIGQRRDLKRRLFKELNQPIDYKPKYTFKC
jgi:hypothetical protein